MSPRYGRAYAGERATTYTPYHRGNKLTMISAISVNEVEAAMYLEGSADGETFLHFLEKHLCPVLKAHHTVVMDNVSFHKVKGVTQMIEATGAQIEYLPPYHPEFNPIEEMWSKLKLILRQRSARTLRDFKKSIKHAFQGIVKSDLEGWYKHAGL